MKKLTLTLISLIAVFSSFAQSSDIFTVSPTESSLKWTGYHLAKSYEHFGNVNIKSGSLTVANGLITAGEFVIDMNTITNADVKEAKENAKLVNHLKSDDFFNVKKFPEAKLVIKNSVADGTNLNVTGDLTIRGITKSIQFKATLNDKNTNRIEATAELIIQRTDFEVMYGWKAANAILSGEFKMEIQLVATK